MNKSDIIEKVWRKNQVSKDKIYKIVNDVFDEMFKALSSGKDVKITSFGSFIIKTHKARPARNPITGREIWIRERKKVKFVPSEALKNEVSER